MAKKSEATMNVPTSLLMQLLALQAGASAPAAKVEEKPKGKPGRPKTYEYKDEVVGLVPLSATYSEVVQTSTRTTIATGEVREPGVKVQGFRPDPEGSHECQGVKGWFSAGLTLTLAQAKLLHATMGAAIAAIEPVKAVKAPKAA